MAYVFEVHNTGSTRTAIAVTERWSDSLSELLEPN